MRIPIQPVDRLAGAHSEVNNLKDALNRGNDNSIVSSPPFDLHPTGEWPITSYTDINTVCDLLKTWFRVLPGGMFPDPAHVRLMGAASE